MKYETNKDYFTKKNKKILEETNRQFSKVSYERISYTDYYYDYNFEFRTDDTLKLPKEVFKGIKQFRLFLNDKEFLLFKELTYTCTENQNSSYDYSYIFKGSCRNVTYGNWFTDFRSLFFSRRIF